ncbi:MAG TPA: restriction endonuclease [Pyrinomonadaceae bacterium]|nr:restriction endonuclease [Pyrinomonadaceae bacterium]
MGHANNREAFSKLILGATKSIELVTAIGYDVFDGSPYQQITVTHPRLLLRAVVPSPIAWMNVASLSTGRRVGRKVIETRTRLESWGWKTKVVEFIPKNNFAIVDREKAIIYNDSDFRFTDSQMDFETTLDITAAEELYRQYEIIWSHDGALEVLFEDLRLLHPAEAQKIIVASNQRWEDVIKQLSQNPKILCGLEPRGFEELVAELLVREGMRVELTPPSKDGGIDILAFSDTQAGEHLYYVECKRYSPENPVGVSIARSLHGVVEAGRATAGLLVTTSYFTKGALSFRESVKHRLSLKDYDSLVEWLKQSAR